MTENEQKITVIFFRLILFFISNYSLLIPSNTFKCLLEDNRNMSSKNFPQIFFNYFCFPEVKKIQQFIAYKKKNNKSSLQFVFKPIFSLNFSRQNISYICLGRPEKMKLSTNSISLEILYNVMNYTLN
jgi:hypothetical protein